jgi:hypothetical protein
MIEFINILYTPFATKDTYKAIADPTLNRSLLYTLASSVCYTLHLSPGNGFQHSSYISLTHEAFVTQRNSFLHIIVPNANTGKSTPF